MMSIRVSLQNIVEKKNRHVSRNKVAIYLLGLKSRNANYQKPKIPVSFKYKYLEYIILPASFTVLMINKSEISSMNEHIKAARNSF